MRASQLESVVLQAVASVRAGESAEHDLIELKRSWPDTDKVRQLAAAANSADGEELIYVIGIDEKSGEIAPTRGTDPAKWWSQMEAGFDEVAPELERHLRVVVSEGESVIALLFRTDRAPYVVKVSNGGATEREVPIRAGTRTRSAHRHELLRLLYPTVQVPQLSAVDGYLSLGSPSYSGGDSDRVVHLALRSQLFFEHVQPDPAFLPQHLSSVRLVGVRGPKASKVYYDSKDDYALVGVSRRFDGLQVFGSGTAHVRALWAFDIKRTAGLAERETWSVILSFAVAGTDRESRLEYRFGKRSEEPESSYSRPGTRYNWSLQETVSPGTT